MEENDIAVMADGTNIPYRLDGNLGSDAPLIVLSNPSLVDLSFWDEFLDVLSENPLSKKYRFLRYNNRGRTRHDAAVPLTLDILTEDLISILDNVHVGRAAAMVGISLGGLTLVNLALKHPERVGAIMACDFGPQSPPGNAAVWNSRLEIARRDAAEPRDRDGNRLCGNDLATVTVQRWLSAKSRDGGIEDAKVRALEKMVQENSLDGFASIVEAISVYNLRKGVKYATVPATFVVGADDTAMVKPMEEMAANYGHGALFKVIKDAGHLPVVDRPREFVNTFAAFLASSTQCP